MVKSIILVFQFNYMIRCLLSLFFFFILNLALLQAQSIKWAKDGSSYYAVSESGDIEKYRLPQNTATVVVPKEQLTPANTLKPLEVDNFFFSSDGQKLLIYTNTKRVWRYNTRGDYWVFDKAKNTLMQLGTGLTASSLMFAKFSPDGNSVAYVSNYNLYVQNINSGEIKQLTQDGNRKLIYGTFDWVYEEEFNCRDGFRWSPDGKQIAFWQIDAKTTRDYLMLNTTDSVYSQTIPVEYPVVGEPPSPYKIGVINISTQQIKWMNIPTDPVWQTYVPRMGWAANSNELILQHLNRKQNESKLMLCNALTGAASVLSYEKDAAWIEAPPPGDDDPNNHGWYWTGNGKELFWLSEKDGWNHLYRIDRTTKKEQLITTGNYDIIKLLRIDEKGGYAYFLASPDNATQKYLYRTKLDGKGKPERLSSATQPGTHDYDISPNAQFAKHDFSNYYTKPVGEWVSLPTHKVLGEKNIVSDAIASADKKSEGVEFFKVKTAEGVEMDGWMIKPANFDPSKKYPVLFHVYTEPASQRVRDVFGIARNGLYDGNMAQDGYVYICIDNRGTPAPKGAKWRKCIYRKIGRMNITDQAMAAKEILKWPFIDAERVAVWGWSGGGSATLNLMFQFPDIYKTGIAIAAVTNQLTYDNIYQERYMGLPQENREDFVNGSPINYAKNLKGNLLYIHGTGDDNVHYNNAEMLINELIKYNRQFQLMSYPNRSHGIYEGEGTTRHLATLFTNYLKQHCPPGGR
jgi:dipeptidyl-peptidase-4